MVTSPIVCTARCTGPACGGLLSPGSVLSGILVEQMIRSEAYRCTGVLFTRITDLLWNLPAALLLWKRSSTVLFSQTHPKTGNEDT